MADGEKTPVSLGLIERASLGLRYVFTGQRPGDWFGPGAPPPAAAPGSVAGRQNDYPVGINLYPRPKTSETRTSYDSLRALADTLDLARLCIETRKDQMEKLEFSIQPKKLPGQLRRPKADGRCVSIKKFFDCPDGEHSWSEWLRILLEDMFVIDAPTLFVRRTRSDRLFALEPIDGATIARVLDDWGRTPRPPNAAYQQVLKGMPATSYTRPVAFGDTPDPKMGELIYKPRNLRSNRIYGFSHIEQIITTIQIALRSQLSQLAYFTEGNVPDALVGVPPDWDADKIEAFQKAFDLMIAGDLAQKRRIKFLPGGFDLKFTREPVLKNEFHEWLARVVCYCFSLPPTAFVQQVNRATAQTAKEQAQQEGLAPLMMWVKNLVDYCIATFWGADDLEFVWDSEQELDPATRAQIHVAYKNAGILSTDEVRADLGRDPMQVEAMPPGMGGAPQIPGQTPDDQMAQGDDQQQTQAVGANVGMMMLAPPQAQQQAPQAEQAPPQDMQGDPQQSDGEPEAERPAEPEPEPRWADQHRPVDTWADEFRGDSSWAGQFRGGDDERLGQSVPQE